MVPSAANIAIQRPGFPDAMISTDQKVERHRPIAGHAQIDGRWCQTMPEITQIGMPHHSASGRYAAGTSHASAVGGYSTCPWVIVYGPASCSG